MLRWIDVLADIVKDIILFIIEKFAYFMVGLLAVSAVCFGIVWVVKWFY